MEIESSTFGPAFRALRSGALFVSDFWLLTKPKHKRMAMTDQFWTKMSQDLIIDPFTCLVLFSKFRRLNPCWAAIVCPWKWKTFLDSKVKDVYNPYHTLWMCVISRL